MKKLIIVILVIVMIMTFVGCNMQMIDTTWSHERAIIQMPDGNIVEGAVTSWQKYPESDMLQVKIDGKQYLTHSVNVVLISE